MVMTICEIFSKLFDGGNGYGFVFAFLALFEKPFEANML